MKWLGRLANVNAEDQGLHLKGELKNNNGV